MNVPSFEGLIGRFLGFWFSQLAMLAVVGCVGLLAVFGIFAQDLPNHAQLANYQPPTLSRVYSGSGEVIDEFARERRIFVPINEIPELLTQAFVSAEDKNFYVHRGFDPFGIAVALYQAAMHGDRLRGASTITQQVMKNFLLSSDRSFDRKIREIILASRLETTLSKDQILELYLNEIFLGQNSYGVAAAAQTYFGKSLDALDLAEVAYLAALPKEPSALHPVRDRARAVARRNYVLREMHDNGYIDDATLAAALAEPLATVQGGDLAGSRAAPRDYFTDEVRRQLSATLGDEALFTGGLAIRATIDPDLQKVAAEAMREGLEAYDRAQGVYRGPVAHIDPSTFDATDVASWRKALGAADVARDISGWYPVVVLSVGDRAARIGVEGVEDDSDGHFLLLEDMAWARVATGGGWHSARKMADLLSVGDVIHVSPSYDESGAFRGWTYRQIPEVQGGFMAMDTHSGRVLAMQGGFSYQSSSFNRATQALRQPGSSFKPFVYAAALDNGLAPNSIVEDSPISIRTASGEIWSPQNSGGKSLGAVPLRIGIEQSRNLMTVRVAREIGMDKVAEVAERFGIYDDMKSFLPLSLGAGETTLYRMVSAYAMLANGGIRVEPSLVDRVQDRYGRTIYRHDQRGCEGCDGLGGASDPKVVTSAERVLDPVTDYQITSMLRGAVARGTSAASVGTLGLNLAGKTGTTNDAKDVWFIGYSPDIAAGCYMGFDQPRNLGATAFGGTLCAPIFQKFIAKVMEGKEPIEWPVPAGGHFVKVDRWSGRQLAAQRTGDAVIEEFLRDAPGSVSGKDDNEKTFDAIEGTFGDDLNRPRSMQPPATVPPGYVKPMRKDFWNGLY